MSLSYILASIWEGWETWGCRSVYIQKERHFLELNFSFRHRYAAEVRVGTEETFVADAAKRIFLSNAARVGCTTDGTTLE